MEISVLHHQNNHNQKYKTDKLNQSNYETNQRLNELDSNLVQTEIKCSLMKKKLEYMRNLYEKGAESTGLDELMVIFNGHSSHQVVKHEPADKRPYNSFSMSKYEEKASEYLSEPVDIPLDEGKLSPKIVQLDNPTPIIQPVIKQVQSKISPDESINSSISTLNNSEEKENPSEICIITSPITKTHDKAQLVLKLNGLHLNENLKNSELKREDKMKKISSKLLKMKRINQLDKFNPTNHKVKLDADSKNLKQFQRLPDIKKIEKETQDENELEQNDLALKDVVEIYHNNAIKDRSTSDHFNEEGVDDPDTAVVHNNFMSIGDDKSNVKEKLETVSDEKETETDELVPKNDTVEECDRTQSFLSESLAPKHYQQPTQSSVLKRANRNSINTKSTPFVVGTSIESGSNLILNIQRVYGLMKGRQKVENIKPKVDETLNVLLSTTRQNYTNHNPTLKNSTSDIPPHADVKGSSSFSTPENIKNVFTRLNEQFDTLNQKYENVKKQLEKSKNNKYLEKLMTDLEIELTNKEEEIGAFISLYTDVINMQKQLLCLNNINKSQATIQSPPSRQKSKVSSSMKLTKLLRQIQTFQKELNNL